MLGKVPVQALREVNLKIKNGDFLESSPFIPLREPLNLNQ